MIDDKIDVGIFVDRYSPNTPLIGSTSHRSLKSDPDFNKHYNLFTFEDENFYDSIKVNVDVVIDNIKLSAQDLRPLLGKGMSDFWTDAEKLERKAFDNTYGEFESTEDSRIFIPPHPPKNKIDLMASYFQAGELRKTVNRIGLIPLDYHHEIVDLLAARRYQMLKECQAMGLSVFLEKEGIFRIGSAVSVPRDIEQSAFKGQLGRVTEEYNRLSIVVDRSTSDEAILAELEEMINTPGLAESYFQKFFQKYPQLIFDAPLEEYWSEPVLKGADSQIIRPDFIFAPAARRVRPWYWEMIDLKRADLGLLTNKNFHAAYGKRVYQVVEQLKDYDCFFRDPRNSELLKRHFGGIVPMPKLTAIIGRLPPDGDIRRHIELLRRQEPVCIKTYDDILEMKRASASRERLIRGLR